MSETTSYYDWEKEISSKNDTTQSIIGDNHEIIIGIMTDDFMDSDLCRALNLTIEWEGEGKDLM